MVKFFLVRRNDHNFGKPHDHFFRMDLTKVAFKKINHTKHIKINIEICAPNPQKNQLHRQNPVSIETVHVAECNLCDSLTLLLCLIPWTGTSYGG